MAGLSRTRLAHPRIEPQVGDELARRAEARDLADSRQERQRRLGSHSGDRQQAASILVAEEIGARQALELGDLGRQEVDLAQARIQGQPLVGGQL